MMQPFRSRAQFIVHHMIIPHHLKPIADFNEIRQ
jgi:hypothetical protein